jgi:hypothetical protein
LTERGFRHDAADAESFAAYIRQGWCFVTARIRKGASDVRTVENLPHPLALLFETPQAVYPLALTATIGAKTEVLLFVMADSRQEADSRFEVEWAGMSPVQPPTVKFGDTTFQADAPYLTKMRGRLSPEEMRRDLRLQKAATNEPYCKKIYVW